jgi:uncharacterized OsmC-like protein
MITTKNEETMTTRQVNGIDVETLMGTVNAIKNEPELGASKFRASNKWMGGSQNRSCVTGFYGAKQEMEHKQSFRMDADEPAILAGTDEAANPVEHLLHALASCMTTSMVAHAAVRGIQIEELESQLEGDLDLRGFLGLDASVPKGYTNIRATFRVKAKEEDMDRIRELVAFSPVLNTVTNSAIVNVEVKRK